MEGHDTSSSLDERIRQDAPQLIAMLQEMKASLDTVRSKAEHLTAKVRESHYSTADGISYLEAKNLLLLNYCQSLVYYLFRKANGLSIEGHPVVRSLVEIRLFLEKIRSIDKKLQYQIQKLTRVDVVAGANEEVDLVAGRATRTDKADDLLKYRPNPDGLIDMSIIAAEESGGIYQPPRFAPTVMEQEEERKEKEERDALRREKRMLRKARESAYIRELVDDLAERPEEVKEVVGTESKEVRRFVAKMEARARQEEELFTRAPITSKEKKRAKHLEKSRNGLLGLADGFYDEIRALPLGDDGDEPVDNGHLTNISSKKRHKRKR